MSENPNLEARDGSRESDAGVSRRRLMRAGLAAAPVILTFKSQSVLAADQCIKPSAFASVRAAGTTALSHAPNPAGFTCFSHGYWKNHAHPSPYSTKLNSYFLTKPSLPVGYVSAGFTANPGNAYTTLTLDGVLNLSGDANNAALARHVVGTFLTAVANGDDPTKVLLTTAQCKTIWNNQGVWSPMTGVTWNLADTMAYFSYVYGS